MKKTLELPVLMILISTSILISLKANAVFNPERTAPIAMAKLTVKESNGDFQNIRKASLKVVRARNYEIPRQLRLILDGREYGFVISDTQEDTCGAQMFIAANTSMAHDISMMSLVFTDHSASQCQFEKAWSAEVLAFDQAGNMNGRLLLNGQPETIFTPQVQQPL